MLSVQVEAEEYSSPILENKAFQIPDITINENEKPATIESQEFHIVAPPKNRPNTLPRTKALSRTQSLVEKLPKKKTSFDTSSEWIRNASPKVLAQIPPKNKSRYSTSVAPETAETAETAKKPVSVDGSCQTESSGDTFIELDRLKGVVQELSERLIDEVETRSEIEHGNTMLVSESERLTSELFSEAQNMVVQERKLRHEGQVRMAALERQIKELVDIAATDKAEIQMLKCLIQDSHENKAHSKSLQFAEEETFAETDSARETPEPSDEGSPTVIYGVSKRAVRIYGDSSDAAFSPAQVKLARSYLHAGILQYHPGNSDYLEIVEMCRSNNHSNVNNLKFIKRLVAEEAVPCIQFESPRLGMLLKYKLTRAIKNNKISLQKLFGQNIDELPAEGRVCFLTDQSTISTHTGTCYLLWLEEERNSAPSSAGTSTVSSPTQPSIYTAVRSSFGSFMFSNSQQTDGSAADHQNTSSELPSLLSSPNTSTAALAVTNFPSTSDTVSGSSASTPRYISLFARERVVAACDFYKFLSMVHLGHLTSATPDSIYFRLVALSERLFFAKLGLLPEIEPASLF